MSNVNQALARMTVRTLRARVWNASTALSRVYGDTLDPQVTPTLLEVLAALDTLLAHLTEKSAATGAGE